MMGPPEKDASRCVDQEKDKEKQYVCRTCSKTFGRAEHRRRHELTHSSDDNDKPFKCSACPKRFIRRDALQRHQLTHQAPPNLLQRGGRACSACVSAKARCSGRLPCTRCQHKNIPCLHPDMSMLSPVSFDTAQQPSHAIFAAPSTMPPHGLGHAHGHGHAHSLHVPVTHPAMFDFESWEQNILAATNWLDVTYNADYSNFAYPNMPFGETTMAPESLPFVTATPARSQLFSNPVQLDSPASVVSLQSTALTASQASDNAADTCTQEVGEFYVDGEPARLPRVKRLKTSTSNSQPTPLFPSSPLAPFSLASPSNIGPSSAEFTLRPEAYTDIQDAYQRFCLHPLEPWPPFESLQLPSETLLAVLGDLYFKHSDQVLPFIHRGLIAQKGILVLAIAAIGAQYVEENLPPIFAKSINEFVRRWLIYLHETPTRDGHRTCSLMSAQLLNLVAMSYHGDDRFLSTALKDSHWLPRIFTEASNSAVSTIPASHNTGSEDMDWLSWCERESNIRLAYSAWLVDAMLAYHFDYEPRMALRDCTLPLPSAEKLWSAPTAQQWRETYNSSSQPTLNEALRTMYIEKRLARETGEFARVLIVHGLFQRQWEVEAYLKNPLSQWEPTANRQPASDLPSSAPWLPSIPTFTRWQNSACDCLDILHWQANATIGQASGLEHPTVMHLHLARIVLLAPHKEIVALVRQMTTPKTTATHDSLLTNQHLIRRWAVQHQYKARLAAIHAGVTLWHVRRYSIDAFYEAPAVALAALVLWAFGTFSNPSASPSDEQQKQQQQQQQQQQEDSEQSDDTGCSIILLDRPTDDELVQQFIRNGGSMQAHITGVGDLYAVKGPERVLVQGCKLLSSLKCWGVALSWQKLLQGLVDVLKDRRVTAAMPP